MIKNLIFRWWFKRTRKKIFRHVTNVAEDFLNKYNHTKNLYPDAPKSKLYKLTLQYVFQHSRYYTQDDIDKVLIEAKNIYAGDEALRLYHLVAAFVHDALFDLYPIASEPLRSPFDDKYFMTDREPKDWETYTSYLEIILKVIPEDL